MVSRRKILSRSRDNLADTQYEVEEEEDVWYNVDKLYKDHIQEVLDKWNQIDDEIWAKVIVFERNRRVAKAYARAPVLTVNDSMDGFDGFRIGLCGFDNPMRDAKTEEARRQINHGVKIKMDGDGNILIKRMCKSNVYVRPTSQAENAIGPEIVRNSQGALEYDKPGKLFDMAKFSANLTQETRQAYPDRRRLETQCLSAIVFVKTDADLLQCPIWVLIVNVVGLDMLKSKLPPVGAVPRPVDIKNRPRIPIPDEDPYSIAGTSSSTERGIGSSSGGGGHPAFAAYKQHQLEREHARLTGHRRGGGSAGGAGKPPKLPPRENLYGHDIPKPDYDDIENDYAPSSARAAAMDDKKSKKENNKKYDDPYYCGLRARVPNFVKMANKSNGHHLAVPTVQPAMSMSKIYAHSHRSSQQHQQQQYVHSNGNGHHHPHHHHQHSNGHGHHPQAVANAAAYAYPLHHSQSAQIYGHLPADLVSKRQPIMYHARSFESGLGECGRQNRLTLQSHLRKTANTNEGRNTPSTTGYVHWRMGLKSD
ncbi:uncharacterized protein LOC106657503 isoform X1 [Trichogramma pretiosum]|uniref:uncharacterized protein LOC106657503 isoform X1 n=1 Tax=Trichogramma pretiosum TaxID=7493 RepID=UPI000C71BB6D|nr:uncharacterized protein LOC106657503 isoform X1 [Trichogramma pretiosum]